MAVPLSSPEEFAKTLLKPFVEGVKSVVTMSTGMEVAEEPILSSGLDQNLESDISGIIELDVADFKGTVRLNFTSSAFLKIYELMLGEAHESINEEVADGAAELLNMVYGQAKNSLKQQGLPLEKAIPRVVSGKRVFESIEGNGSQLIAPFKTDFGTFHLEIIVQ